MGNRKRETLLDSAAGLHATMMDVEFARVTLVDYSRRTCCPPFIGHCCRDCPVHFLPAPTPSSICSMSWRIRLEDETPKQAIDPPAEAILLIVGLLKLFANSSFSPKRATRAGRTRDLPKALMQRAGDARHSDVMARHLEILYLVAKNRCPLLAVRALCLRGEIPTGWPILSALLQSPTISRSNNEYKGRREESNH
ncbi:hypothetical protein PENTCL1PPCAC_21759 [Pristionchus entomophagus]|uniref:Ribosomal protein n=1 Tax=Pristionchus entomophagus TaxID=358040 RepID=A0AAV5TYM0_9BILA|nr:hypothetical protein PENTCL1PPCAC_21759 [Pristionchus entomophagus]